MRANVVAESAELVGFHVERTSCRCGGRSTGNEPISTTRQLDPGALRVSLLGGLEAALAELGLEADDRQRDRLVDLAELVAQWGARMNLTGHRDPGSVMDGLVLDALALRAALDELLDSPPRRLADLGSGAGFPGLPFAILDPDLHVDLIDSRERRHYFQRAACRQLGIANAHPRLGRIEVLEPEPADLVIAQALGPIAEVIALARPWVAAGGWLVVPSGPKPPRPCLGAEWQLDGARPYRTPGGGAPRSFWFARKVGEEPGGTAP